MADEKHPDRRHEETRARLEQKMTDLTIAVVGMKGAMDGLARGLQTEINELQDSNVKQRRLSKYNRRTHFMVLSYVAVLGLLISDLGRRYCGIDGHHVGEPAAQACNATFWTTEHGGGVGWRIAGFLLQVAIVIVLTKRSQVPSDLYPEIAVAQIKRDRADRSWWRVS